MTATPLSAADIRARRAASDLRDRDFAASIGLAEAQLVAAHVGHGAIRIAAETDRLFPAIETLGEVMALTRNESCVIEKVGTYANYHPGQHAALVLTEAIDLRMFPRHWVTAFAVERETDSGPRRSLQIFDAAGDAVHKVHLREGSDLAAWDDLVAALKLPEQPDHLDVDPRQPVEGAKENPNKLDILRAEWTRMTDTHQFLRLTAKLRMNRLGAYRSVARAGDRHFRRLPTEAVARALEAARDQATEVMIFVGNQGCIEIHGGPIGTLKPMGPWINILDEGFNLHLRGDHIAEVWAVEKPTQRGPAFSIEAFDAEGTLITQIFGRRTEAGGDFRPAWNQIVAALPSLETESA